jgi:hypothetical protein
VWPAPDMAEAIAAISLVATVASLADYGLQLSTKLSNFSKAVATADNSIEKISGDIAGLSAVLQQLGLIIESDKSRVVAKTALDATQREVNECRKIFEDLNGALQNSMKILGLLESGEGKRRPRRALITLERLKWPFKQGKMELLQSNLETRKSSLSLMVEVLNLAHNLSNKYGLPPRFTTRKEHGISCSQRIELRLTHPSNTSLSA